MNSRITTLSCLLMTMTACATHAPSRAERAPGPEAALKQPHQLLGWARQLQAEKGCQSASPAYRVAASLGEGYEVAQFELGLCLLQMQGETDVETALFQKEAAFWIERAAWAGEARAQTKLSSLLDPQSPDAIDAIANPARALGWALIYDANGARDLYALQPTHFATLEALRSALSAEEIAEAERFAEDFRLLQIAGFVAPPNAQRANRSGARAEPGADRRSKRRPRNASST